MKSIRSCRCYDLVMKVSLSIVLLLGCGLLSAAEKPAVPVRVAVVEKTAMRQELPLTGLFASRLVSSLSSRVDALVAKVLVEAGDFVQAGAVLIELDKALIEYDALRARAALEEARARLRESVRKRDELGKLMKNQYLAKTAFQAAEAKVRIDRAIVKRLQAARRRSQELVRQHSIAAPFSGVVSRRFVEAGQWLKVGNAVLELVDVDALRVEVAVPQRYFAELQVGTAAVIHADALPGQALSAVISRIIPVADRTAHTFLVYIAIDNQQRRYMPGMSAQVVLQLAGERGSQAVLLVPRDAIVKQGGQQDRVWVVDASTGAATVHPITVSTGRSYQGQVEIVGGDLQAGQQIVVRGNENLRPGQRVRVLQ